jgi:hypothetical protein
MLLQSEATDRAACIRSSWQASFYPDRPGIPGKQGLRNATGNRVKWVDAEWITEND